MAYIQTQPRQRIDEKFTILFWCSFCLEMFHLALGFINFLIFLSPFVWLLTAGSFILLRSAFMYWMQTHDVDLWENAQRLGFITIATLFKFTPLLGSLPWFTISLWWLKREVQKKDEEYNRSLGITAGQVAASLYDPSSDYAQVYAAQSQQLEIQLQRKLIAEQIAYAQMEQQVEQAIMLVQLRQLERQQEQERAQEALAEVEYVQTVEDVIESQTPQGPYHQAANQNRSIQAKAA